jgi:prepilin-type N-terminal cleavage/methylation domain-containing protein
VKNKASGFSLLELIITMAIALILTICAAPSYKTNVMSWQAQQAKLYLDNGSIKLASWLLAHGSYAGASLQNLGISDLQHYKMSLNCSEHSYELIASRDIDGKQIIRRA